MVCYLTADFEEPLFVVAEVVVVVVVGNDSAAKPIPSKGSGFAAKCNEASLRTSERHRRARSSVV